MAEKEQQNPVGQEQETNLAQEFSKVDVALAKSEAFIENNQKNLLMVLAGIIVLIFAFVWFYRSHQQTEKDANVEIAKAQMAFVQDSVRIALEGNDDVTGFLSIIDDYSGTDAAKISKFYAGLCYKKLGENGDAIKYLEDASLGDNMLEASRLGALGDCYLDTDDAEAAKKYYKKAVNMNNSVVSPIYMQRLAMLLSSEGNNPEAAKIMADLKKQYPESEMAKEADKYESYFKTKK